MDTAGPRSTESNVAAQHCVFVPEDEKLGIPRHLMPRQHGQAAEETPREQVTH